MVNARWSMICALACMCLFNCGCSMEYRAKRAIAKKEGWSMSSFICTQQKPPDGRKFVVRRKVGSGDDYKIYYYYFDGNILLKGW